jgi:hypothetical protein
MNLDHDACYRIFLARDRRFDGRVFVGVRTTGIYCRPICPAPPPRQYNVSFYPSAALAQEAGFRPCLRCRPEVSPDFAAWRGSSSTVVRALRLIQGGALDQTRTSPNSRPTCLAGCRTYASPARPVFRWPAERISLSLHPVGNGNTEQPESFSQHRSRQIAQGQA